MADYTKAFEVSDDGIQLDNGIWVGSGSTVPTLNAPEGSRYWRTSPAEEYRQEGPGVTNNWVLSTTGMSSEVVTFWHDGGAGNKWLRRQNHHTESSGPQSDSKSQPFPFCYDGEIIGYSYISKDTDTDIDIEIYKNGALNTTWNIRNRKWECDTSITAIAFSAGDKLSIFTKKFSGGTGDDSPDSVLLDVFVSFTDNTAQKIGGSTL